MCVVSHLCSLFQALARPSGVHFGQVLASDLLKNTLEILGAVQETLSQALFLGLVESQGADFGHRSQVRQEVLLSHIAIGIFGTWKAALS